MFHEGWTHPPLKWRTIGVLFFFSRITAWKLWINCCCERSWWVKDRSTTMIANKRSGRITVTFDCCRILRNFFSLLIRFFREIKLQGSVLNNFFLCWSTSDYWRAKMPQRNLLTNFWRWLKWSCEIYYYCDFIAFTEWKDTQHCVNTGLKINKSMCMKTNNVTAILCVILIS